MRKIVCDSRGKLFIDSEAYFNHAVLRIRKILDLTPDPVIFVTDLQDSSKK
jgi:hypothetical protein